MVIGYICTMPLVFRDGGEPCGDDERGVAGREHELRHVRGREDDERGQEWEWGPDGWPERDCARGPAGAGRVLCVRADGAERMVADGVGVGH